jgi:tRNA1(Val) A37 N6-methylase TrmN6
LRLRGQTLALRRLVLLRLATGQAFLVRMDKHHADEVSEASSVLIEARKDGAPYCHLLPPLLLHTQDSRSLPHRPLTPRAQHIYDTMQWSDTEEGN